MMNGGNYAIHIWIQWVHSTNLGFPWFPSFMKTLLSNLKVMVKPNLPQRTKTEDDPHEQSIEARHTSKPWDLCCETSKIPLRQQGGPLLDINGVMGMLWGPYKWPKINGYLGLVHPYKWSHGPLLLPGRDPPWTNPHKKHWRAWNPGNGASKLWFGSHNALAAFFFLVLRKKKTFEARVEYRGGFGNLPSLRFTWCVLLG